MKKQNLDNSSHNYNLVDSYQPWKEEDARYFTPRVSKQILISTCYFNKYTTALLIDTKTNAKSPKAMKTLKLYKIIYLNLIIDLQIAHLFLNYRSVLGFLVFGLYGRFRC